jgi:type II secretory pathway component PulC
VIRLTKKNLTIVNAVLLGLLLVTLAAVAVPYLKSEPLETVSPVTRGTTRPAILESERPLSGARKEEQLAKIIDRSIFRDPRLVIEKPVVVAPPPPLQWTLVGVTSIRGEAVAIIRDMKVRGPTGQKEYMVREGDEVEGYFGVRITGIETNPPSVMYNRPGVGDEILTMDVAATGAPGSAKDQWAEAIRAVREGHTYVVKIPELQVRVGSAEAYMTTFGFEPNMEGTRSTGLKITSLARDNLLYLAGLRQGDIIRTINGNPVTDQASLLAQLAEAAQGFNIQVQIERGRTSQTMFYTLLKK